MTDDQQLEALRLGLMATINSKMSDRERLEAEYGPVWNTEEVKNDFIITGFLAPFVTVIRKSDNQRGILKFQHSPRFYFDFTPDS